MSYAVEWLRGGVVVGIIVVLLVVPEFAAIAVLVIALAALVVLLALVAAALASPYVLVRSLRRRLVKRMSHRRARSIHSPSGIPSRAGG